MATLSVATTSFQEGEMIPKRYACDGANVSPALSWGDVPARAESLAILCEDPDAARGVWTHWVLYNLPRGTTALQEGVPKDETLQDGAHQGMNDSKLIGYDGPCPPPGPAHHYFYRVYALDTMLTPTRGMTRKQLLEAMEGHIVAQGEVMGRYQR